MQLDDTLIALADETRRSILKRLAAGEARVTEVEPGPVKLERLLPGTLERVWAYITEPDERAKWFCAGELDRRVGGKVRLEFDNDSLTREKGPPEEYNDVQNKKFDRVVTRL